MLSSSVVVVIRRVEKMLAARVQHQEKVAGTKKENVNKGNRTEVETDIAVYVTLEHTLHRPACR